ncbi:hypothetical protein HanRHA438_Chr04g0153741 [Helianthus annuus]|nr:hypothetical protein HanRHA438_Chr04g0153741 [Helianthus annuus]
MHLSRDSAAYLRLHFFLLMFVDYVYMLSFQYHCSNIVVSMKVRIPHQPFNFDVAVSLLQHREKLHVLPSLMAEMQLQRTICIFYLEKLHVLYSLMGELHCSIFVKSKVRFSCAGKIFFFYRKYRFVQYCENSDVQQQLRRDLCILDFMAMLKDIHREVQQSMELNLKFLNSCCYS